jgi:hypothetical protein
MAIAIWRLDVCPKATASRNSICGGVRRKVGCPCPVSGIANHPRNTSFVVASRACPNRTGRHQPAS